jgi:predicted lipoprotein with Yx(FWY)xxD motif
MALPKRAFFALVGLVLVMIVSACGSTNSTTSGSTPTASTPTAAPATLQTAQAPVKGKTLTILTDAQGKTLYYFAPDSATKAVCTGACAQNWPPLLFTGSGSPTGTSSLTGTLSVLNDANGNQVEYGGYLLYHFSGDTAAGQTNGEGIGGKWFVATPDLASFVVRIAEATVKGNAETILSTPKGLTLYYFTPDTATKAACTGACAQNWPPLVSTSSSTTLGDLSLPSTLTVVTNANCNQVEYNGHLLYTFSGDSAAGQTNGAGLFGKWFVCTPGLAAA